MAADCCSFNLVGFQRCCGGTTAHIPGRSLVCTVSYLSPTRFVRPVETERVALVRQVCLNVAEDPWTSSKTNTIAFSNSCAFKGPMLMPKQGGGVPLGGEVLLQC